MDEDEEIVCSVGRPTGEVLVIVWLSNKNFTKDSQ
jgi:hypothetical protein